jgi:hypothetical protein
MRRVPGTDCQKELQRDLCNYVHYLALAAKKKRLDKAKPLLSFRRVPTDSCKDVYKTKEAKEVLNLVTGMREMK